MGQVITSSFGSMMDVSKGLWPEHTYNEEDWNPITMEEALQNPGAGYSGKPTVTKLNLANSKFLTIQFSKQDIRREGSLGIYGERIPQFHPVYHPAAPRVRSCCAESGQFGLLKYFEPVHSQLHSWSRKGVDSPNYSETATEHP